MRESKENIAKSKEAKDSWSEGSFDLVLNRLVSEPTLSIGSHTMRLTRTRASTNRAQTYTNTDYVSKCARGKIGTGRRQDGWAGSVSNYRLLITPSDPPFVVLRRNSRPHPRLSRRSKILTSARNDSINNASSAIALNTYPVSSERSLYIERVEPEDV